MLSPSVRTLFDFGSKTASSENRTSAEVNGVPSDHVRPGRRWRVCERPSSLDSHRSASHGSSSKLARLTRTRRPCISASMISVVWSRATMRLKERGSLRMVATTCPPRRGGPSSEPPTGEALDRQAR
jgi:hypothetical protein